MKSGSGVKYFREIFVTLLVITDPAGTGPAFPGMPRRRPRCDRNRLARQAAGGLLLLSAIAAQLVIGAVRTLIRPGRGADKG
jgi:small neutral amino acid transporter SnatA (MarC family)